MGQDGSTLEAILLMLRENCIFQKMAFRLGGSAILELRRAEMRPRCQHSSNMSPYSLNERCSQPKPGPLRETSTVALQITIITIAVRPISWGHVGARWGHVGPMSSPIGRSFRPPLGASERNWSVLQKMSFRLGESVISGRPSWPRVGATLGYVRAMLGSCGAYTGRTKLPDEMKASQSLPSSILTSERLEAGDFPDLFLVA